MEGRVPLRSDQPSLATLKMKNVHNDIGSAIQQNNVSTNQYVRAIRRRRRQPTFQLLRTWLEPLLQSWRKLATPHKLSFQPWRQPVSLSKSWRKIALMAVIPFANVAVMVSVVMLALVVVISMLVVTFSVSFALSERGTGSH